jgi:PKD repeat protein
MKNIMRLIIVFALLTKSFFSLTQTVHQVCISEAESAGACGTGSSVDGVFTPGNLTIQVGDQIQFTTHFVALGGYNGTHTIEFSGSPANNVSLTISTNVLSPTTSVTTPPFTTPGTFPMECTNPNHCEIADLITGYSCTGYSVTVVGSGCDVEAGFTASSSEICAGDEVSFTNSSTDATDYEWEVDGDQFSTDENPTYTFPDAGTYEIKLIASDGTCTDEVTTSITVLANPNATINVNPNTSVFVNEEVDITFTTTNTDANTSYSWDFCDDGSGGSFDEDFTYSWADFGTYCACLTLENDNGCSNEICFNDIIVDAINNIDEEELSQLVELYPNPSDGKFKILIHSPDVINFSIINTKGQSLMSFNKNDIENNEVSIDYMASGSYFLVVETSNKRGSLQFIVK